MSAPVVAGAAGLTLKEIFKWIAGFILAQQAAGVGETTVRGLLGSPEETLKRMELEYAKKEKDTERAAFRELQTKELERKGKQERAAIDIQKRVGNAEAAVAPFAQASEAGVPLNKFANNPLALRELIGGLL